MKLSITQANAQARLKERHDKLERALRLHLAFLSSLPIGWLAHTTGDVGLLNDAYLASRDAGMHIPQRKP